MQLGSSFPSQQRGRRGQHRSQIRKQSLADSSRAVKPGSCPQIHLSIPAFSPDQAACNRPAAWHLLVPVPLHRATLEQQNHAKKSRLHCTVVLAPHYLICLSVTKNFGKKIVQKPQGARNPSCQPGNVFGVLQAAEPRWQQAAAGDGTSPPGRPLPAPQPPRAFGRVRGGHPPNPTPPVCHTGSAAGRSGCKGLTMGRQGFGDQAGPPPDPHGAA